MKITTNKMFNFSFTIPFSFCKDLKIKGRLAKKRPWGTLCKRYKKEMLKLERPHTLKIANPETSTAMDAITAFKNDLDAFLKPAVYDWILTNVYAALYKEMFFASWQSFFNEIGFSLEFEFFCRISAAHWWDIWQNEPNTRSNRRHSIHSIHSI